MRTPIVQIQGNSKEMALSLPDTRMLSASYETRNSDHQLRQEVGKTNLEIVKGTVTLCPLVFGQTSCYMCTKLQTLVNDRGTFICNL